MQRGRDLDPGRAQHRVPERRGKANVANLVGFRFDHHGSGRVKLRNFCRQSTFEPFLRGLTLRHAAKNRTAMVGQCLEVDHLHAKFRKFGQNIGLRRSRVPGQNHDRRREGGLVQRLLHHPAIGAITPFNCFCLPADLP